MKFTIEILFTRLHLYEYFVETDTDENKKKNHQFIMQWNLYYKTMLPFSSSYIFPLRVSITILHNLFLIFAHFIYNERRKKWSSTERHDHIHIIGFDVKICFKWRKSTPIEVYHTAEYTMFVYWFLLNPFSLNVNDSNIYTASNIWITHQTHAN